MGQSFARAVAITTVALNPRLCHTRSTISGSYVPATSNKPPALASNGFGISRESRDVRLKWGIEQRARLATGSCFCRLLSKRGGGLFSK